LQVPVGFVADCVGAEARNAVQAMQPGDIVLLENLRYHPEEEANDEAFAKELASLADIFVQDGFGVVHRAHASTAGIPKFIPGLAGLLLEREVDTITNVMSSPERPLAVIIGGAKISDKIELLDIFVDRADFVAVVGAMANTFLLAEGIAVGESVAEPDSVDTARRILEKARERTRRERFTFYLPQDVVVSKGADAKNATRVVDIHAHTWADIQTYPRQPKAHDYTSGAVIPSRMSSQYLVYANGSTTYRLAAGRRLSLWQDANCLASRPSGIENRRL
jgi:phosphoglycerate kinase